MKNFLLTSLFILTFSFSVFSQINEDKNCPKIEINGPIGVVLPNEPWNFKAIIDDKIEKYNPQFFWSILEAEKDEKIIEGQGTLSIKVLFNPDKTNRGVVLEVKGLPEGCPNTASEMQPSVIEYTEPKLIDEFSIANYRIDKARIDNLIIEINNDPSSQAYIIENFSSNTSKQVIAKKIKLISNYISKIRRQEISRFTIITAKNNENLTQFWSVPAGATPPTP